MACFFENSTLSACWKDSVCWRCYFRLRPEWNGRYYCIYKGKALHGAGYYKRKVVLKASKGLYVDESELKHYAIMAQVSKQMAEYFCGLKRKGDHAEIIFIQPAQTYIDSTSKMLIKKFDKRFTKNEFVVFEELLKGDFKKFISEQGIPNTRVRETDNILAAFCHFTYHHSNEEFVVCNLKGVFDSRTNKYSLTSPIIHSKRQQFGRRDRGQEGIDAFFHHHTCNDLCSGWIKPFHVIRFRPLIPSDPPFQ